MQDAEKKTLIIHNHLFIPIVIIIQVARPPAAPSRDQVQAVLAQGNHTTGNKKKKKKGVSGGCGQQGDVNKTIEALTKQLEGGMSILYLR